MAEIFRADFTGAANTPLTSYTPEVGTISSVDSALELSGTGSARIDTAATTNVERSFTLDTTVATADVAVTMSGEVSGNFTLLTTQIRRVDASNFIALNAFNAGGNTVIEVLEVVAGTEFDRGSYDLGSAAPFSARLELIGASCVLYVDGVQRATDTLSSPTTATAIQTAMLWTSTAFTLDLSGVLVESFGTTQTILPDSTVSNTGWTASTTTLWQDTSDGSDATYMSATTDGSVAVLGLANPSPAFASVTGIVITVRIAREV